VDGYMNNNCDLPRVIHTIGHSTRSLEVFIALLKAHRIERVIDVRRWPASKRYPHFGRDALAAALTGEQIEYVWRGDLGGFRKPAKSSPNSGWKVGAFRAYADFMMGDEFRTIMIELKETAEKERCALMCAEAVPWRCHRQLLADAFLIRAWSVRHILDDRCHEHKLPSFARIEGDVIVYSG
jgi:uncharacterized protein (DUF488 family)